MRGGTHQATQHLQLYRELPVGHPYGLSAASTLQSQFANPKHKAPIHHKGVYDARGQLHRPRLGDSARVN